MDGLSFVASLVDALAWPAVVMGALLMFREPLLATLPQVRRLRLGDFEAEFAETMAQIRQDAEEALPEPGTGDGDEEERLLHLAAVAPNAAVLGAWTRVTDAARALLAGNGVVLEPDVHQPYKTIGQLLKGQDLVDTKQSKIFDELRRLRNKVAHAGDFVISAEQAREYVRTAHMLARHLRRTAEGPPAAGG